MLRKITLVAAVAAALLLPVPAFAGHGHGGWHGGHGWHVVTGVAIMGGAVGGLGRMGLGRLVGSEHQHQYRTPLSVLWIWVLSILPLWLLPPILRLLSPQLLLPPLRVLSPIPSLPPLALCATSLVVPSCSRPSTESPASNESGAFRETQEALARLR